MLEAGALFSTIKVPVNSSTPVPGRSFRAPADPLLPLFTNPFSSFPRGISPQNSFMKSPRPTRQPWPPPKVTVVGTPASSRCLTLQVREGESPGGELSPGKSMENHLAVLSWLVLPSVQCPGVLLHPGPLPAPAQAAAPQSPQEQTQVSLGGVWDLQESFQESCWGFQSCLCTWGRGASPSQTPSA